MGGLVHNEGARWNGSKRLETVSLRQHGELELNRKRRDGSREGVFHFDTMYILAVQLLPFARLLGLCPLVFRVAFLCFVFVWTASAPCRFSLILAKKKKKGHPMRPGDRASELLYSSLAATKYRHLGSSMGYELGCISFPFHCLFSGSLTLYQRHMPRGDQKSLLVSYLSLHPPSP